MERIFVGTTRRWIGCSDCDAESPKFPTEELGKEEVLRRFFTPGTTQCFCDNCGKRL